MASRRSTVLRLAFLLLANVTELALGQGLVQSNSSNSLTQSNSVTVSLNILKDRDVSFVSPSGNAVTYKRSSSSTIGISSSSTKGWYGTSAVGSANIVQGKGEAVEGSFVVDDEICIISYINGSHEMSCKLTSDYPPSLDPQDETQLAIVNEAGDKIDINPADSFVGTTKKTMLRSASTSSILDVMVVWTEDAECKKSNLPVGCTVTTATEQTMRNHIDLAVFETNVAYSESFIDAQLRLVHAYRDSTYVESGSFSADLSAIRSTTDGKLDDVHQYRTQYGADLVALLVGNNQYCGMASLGPSKTSMFSVTAYNCATGYYSFGHEIGHNMGCRHDRGQSNACTDTSNYWYGWRDPSANFRTIMAYNCRTNQCDANGGSGCSRIQRFSNPTGTYNSLPLGDAGSDCSRRHNDVRSIVASYYNAIPDCSIDSDCNDNNSCTVDTCNINDGSI